MENNKRKEIAEFYKQIFLDEKLKEKLREEAKKITNEEDLRKLIREEIMPLMKKFKVNFLEEELLEFEKETREELSDEALEGVSGGLSVNSSVAGGILALALVAGGGMALGQTTYAAETAPESSISMQADEKNDDEDEDNEIDFENELVNEWTDENIRAFVDYLDNLSEDHFVDNSEGHGLKDEYENLVNNLRSLKEAIDEEDVEIPDDVDDDLEAYFYFTFADEDGDDYDYNMGNNNSDEDEDDNEVKISDEIDDEVSNEDEDDNEVKISDEINDEVSNEDEDDNELEISDEIDDEVSNEDNEENVDIEIFKEDLRFTPITPHGSNVYNNFAECLNKLPQNYFDMTGAFNDKAPEDLKSNLYLACRYLHVTPEGKVCADQDGKDVISSKVLETLVNFSRCNSGYKFDKYAASHDKLSEVVKFAMFNNPSSIEKLDSQELNQWYVSYLELNQSGELDNLSPEIRDILDVFVLAGGEAEIFSSEETFSNNEEASFTTASRKESSTVNNEEASNTGNGQSSSILARAASATVSAVGSTIRGAGKLVSKIFSFWK